MSSNSILTFIILLLSFVSLEIYSIYLSYTNYGWWMPFYILGLTLLNIIPILFFVFKKTKIAYILIFILALAIIPNQLLLRNKHFHLKEEAANIVNYVFQHKITTGDFPDNIAKYKYRFPDLKDQIQYSKDRENDFIVRYSVGTESTTHYFRYMDGNYWKYYDD